ncbi:MAG TPA: LysR family transcriptional regulator [Dehalococcoidia bacterium]|nr:LysR family transcriptional regulator [Dehalococcoidia bacterium]
MDSNASAPIGARFFQGDLQQLRCFYYAGVYRSFTRAAEELATGQPSISSHIKQLERLLGATLFHRQRRGVELTPAGRALLELAGPLVQAADRLPQELAERTAAQVVSEVRIAAGQELLLHLLGPVIQEFRRENPTVRLVVYARIRSETQAMTARGEIDFGVAARAGLPPGLEFQEVLADDLLLITPWDHRLAEQDRAPIDEVARYPVLMPDRHSTAWHVIQETFARAGLGLEIAMELERWQVIKEFVAMGLGIALVPGFSLGDDTRFAVRRVEPPFPRLSYGIIYRSGAYLSPAARSLVEAIRSRRPDAGRGRREKGQSAVFRDQERSAPS